MGPAREEFPEPAGVAVAVTSVTIGAAALLTGPGTKPVATTMLAATAAAASPAAAKRPQWRLAGARWKSWTDPPRAMWVTSELTNDRDSWRLRISSSSVIVRAGSAAESRSAADWSGLILLLLLTLSA